MDVQLEEKSNIETNEGQVIMSNFEDLAPSEAVTSSQEGEGQVLGYLEVQPSKLGENETTIFAQEYDFNGQQLYYQEGTTADGAPIIMVISRDQDIPSGEAVAQFVQNSGVNSTVSLDGAETKLINDGSNITVVRSTMDESPVDSSALSECGTHISEINPEFPMFISREGLSEVSVINNSDINSSLWTYTTAKGSDKDGMEVVFIPHSKLASTLVLAEDERNQKLLEFACLAQKLEKPIAGDELHSSNSTQDMESAQSMEIMSTEQQDQNVSSSCSQNSHLNDSKYFPVGNVDIISENDPNEGLDLSINKTVQGVSVIHVTSSSDFSDPSQATVLGYIEPEILSDGQNTVIDSAENPSIKYSLINGELIPHVEPHEMDSIKEQSMLIQGQNLESAVQFQIPQVEPDIEKMDEVHNIPTAFEVQNSKDVITNRLSSVLVYNKKELDIVKEAASQISISEETPNDHHIDEENVPDQSDSTVKLIPPETKAVEQVEYIRKSVLTCSENSNSSLYQDSDVHPTSEILENVSQETVSDSVADFNDGEHSTLPVDCEHSTLPVDCEHSTLPVDGEPSNVPLDLDDKQSSLSVPENSIRKSRRTSRRKYAVSQIEKIETVIKPPQRTYSRHSRQPKFSKSVEIPDIESPISPSSPDDENNLIVIDEVNADDGSPTELIDKEDTSEIEESIGNSEKLEKIDVPINDMSENSLDLFETQQSIKSPVNESTTTHLTFDASHDFINSHSSVPNSPTNEIEEENKSKEIPTLPENSHEPTEFSEAQSKSVISNTVDSLLDNFRFSEIDKSPTNKNESLPQNSEEIDKVSEPSNNNDKELSESPTSPSKTKMLTPKKTYLQRKKLNKSFHTDMTKANSVSPNSYADIDLFSYDDLGDNISSVVTNNTRPQSPFEDTVSKASSSDDDSLLFSSDIRNRGSATYRRRKYNELPNSLSNNNQEALNNVSIEGNGEQSGKSPAQSVTNNTFVKQKRIRKLTPKALSFSRQNMSQKVTTALDIENDLNEIKTSGKKGKSKKLLSQKSPETTFYPSTSVTLVKKSRSRLSKNNTNSNSKKSLKSEKPQSTSVSNLIVRQANLTRHQLHEKLNQYNFCDSEETYSDDNQGYRDYANDRKRKSRSVGSKKRKEIGVKEWNEFIKSGPGTSKVDPYLSKIKRRKRPSLDNLRLEPMDNVNQMLSTSFGSDFSRNEYYSSSNQNFKRMKKETIVRLNEVKYMSKDVNANSEDIPTAENGFIRVLPQPESPTDELPTFKCDRCIGFECKYLDNFIFHQSECISPECSEEEVKNMEKRQRLRGEDYDTSVTIIPTDHYETNSVEGSNKEVEMDMMDDDSSSEAEERDENTSGFPYAKKDVVWVELKRLFWPAIVKEVHPDLGKKGKAMIDIIYCPEINGIKRYLTVDVDKLEPFNARFETHNNAGSKHPVHKFLFLKALWTANKFTEKKCLDEEQDMFEDTDEIPDCRSEDDMILEGLNLVEDIMNCVKSGKVNDYLIGILNESIKSERHSKFYSNNSSEKAELADAPWFGPINDLDEQTSFYEYVFKIFKKKEKKSKKEDITGEDLCYVYHVMCPEAIVQAISLIENIDDIAKAEERFMEVTRNAVHYSSVNG